MGGNSCVTEEMALDIMGPSFLARNEVLSLWRRLIKEKGIVLNPGRRIRSSYEIPYVRRTLKVASGEDEQYLVFDPGLSLLDTRAIIGEGCVRNDLRFCKTDDWWLKSPAAFKRRRPGYHLIKAKPCFCGMSWGEQEGIIGESSERISVALTVSVLVSIFFLRKRIILDGCSCWGTEYNDKDVKYALSLMKECIEGACCICLFSRVKSWLCELLGVCTRRKYDKSPV